MLLRHNMLCQEEVGTNILQYELNGNAEELVLY